MIIQIIIQNLSSNKQEKQENIKLKDDKNGSTTSIYAYKNMKRNYFYLGDIKEEQVQTVDKFLNKNNINTINTRLMKLSNKLVYLVSSVKKTNIEWEGTNIIGHYGKINIFIYIYYF